MTNVSLRTRPNSSTGTGEHDTYCKLKYQVQKKERIPKGRKQALKGSYCRRLCPKRTTTPKRANCYSSDPLFVQKQKIIKPKCITKTILSRHNLLCVLNEFNLLTILKVVNYFLS